MTADAEDIGTDKPATPELRRYTVGHNGGMEFVNAADADRVIAEKEAQLSAMHADWHKSEDENAKLKLELATLQAQLKSLDELIDAAERAYAALSPTSSDGEKA